MGQTREKHPGEQELENPETLDQDWKGEPHDNPSRIKGEARMKRDAEISKQAGTHGEPVSDENYDLVSVLYHSLQAVETYDKYCRDAEKAGDKELSDFFEEVIDANRKCAQRAMGLLQRRAGGMAGQSARHSEHAGAGRH